MFISTLDGGAVGVEVDGNPPVVVCPPLVVGLNLAIAAALAGLSLLISTLDGTFLKTGLVDVVGGPPLSAVVNT